MSDYLKPLQAKQMWRKLNDEFAFNYEDRLGQGSFGPVYGGVVLDSTGSHTEVKIAVKVIQEDELVKKFPSYGCRKVRESCERELIATKLSHKNIVETLGSITEPIHPGSAGEDMLKWYIVMEHCDYDRNEYFHKHKPGWPVILNMMLQMTNGIAHLHEEGIIHRDIKPGNILIKLGDGNEVIVKICDFGLVRHVDMDGEFTANVGTDHWKAPELFKDPGKKYCFKVDIFALGHIWLAMCVCDPDKSRHLIAFDGSKYIHLVTLSIILGGGY